MVDIHEAKIHFRELVGRAEAGEEIVIGRAGKPVAKLVPFDQAPAGRRPGLLRGQVWMSEDFDDTPTPLLRSRNTTGTPSIGCSSPRLSPKV